MTLQAKEFDLLVEIYKHLSSDGQRPELAVALLRVMNRTTALKVLENRGVESRATAEGILIPGLPDDHAAALAAELAAGGAGLYRMEERQKSLEDIFLSMTGRRASL